MWFKELVWYFSCLFSQSLYIFWTSYFIKLKVQPVFNCKGRSHELVILAKPNISLFGPKGYFFKNLISLYYILRAYFIFEVPSEDLKRCCFAFENERNLSVPIWVEWCYFKGVLEKSSLLMWYGILFLKVWMNTPVDDNDIDLNLYKTFLLTGYKESVLYKT